ncbi:DUF1385 domain-containing protein [Candidatus Woesearchaeota archaeon]|jgi:uncharacterized protein YqhQ|nr:DUF1385 domain-containing protein [Candidatus Woesearchaeota archaeon]
MNVGGQAVIEGVMMRGKNGISTAVRRLDGSITIKSDKFISYSKRHKILGLPVLRGAVALIESLVVGMKTLSYSADIAIEDEEKKEAKENGVKYKKKSKKEESIWAKVIPILFAFVIGILIFMALPYYLTGHIPITKQTSPVIFNLVAGIIRIFFFLIYVYSISYLDDVKRIFEYHGAEHKTIACYENKKELTPKNAMKYSPLHPRCGTSFLLIAAISCILVFAVIDAIIGSYWQIYLHPPWYLRLLIHLPLIPLVSGISYEFLKFTGKYKHNKFVKILALPGMGLQKITTKEPTMKQLEVAIASLDSVLKMDKKTTK